VTALTAADRSVIARARQLAAVRGEDADAEHVALREHTGMTDIATGYACAFGEARHLLGELAALAERLAGGEDQAAAQITAPSPQDPAPCPDHRPVLDSELGWYCAGCGSEAPPTADGAPWPR
jgi:hypothetical protein